VLSLKTDKTGCVYVAS